MLCISALVLSVIIFTSDDTITPIQNVTIVTAASSNHFQPMLRFIASIPNRPRIIAYDIGLSTVEREILENKYPWVTMRRFDFDQYPDWMRLENAVGHWAWKDVIIHTVCREIGHTVIWCDAGNLFNQSLHQLVDQVRTSGLYSPDSAGTVQKWTHPSTMKYMNVSSDIKHKISRNGACMAFDMDKPWVQDFVQDLYDHCTDLACIGPEGSNRTNHRQDQAVFTVLYYQWQQRMHFPICDEYLGFRIHTD